MKKKIFTLTMLLGFCVLTYAQETFKIMFYNLLNYPIENTLPNRNENLEIILTDYKPDLFLVCELNNETGANSLLNITQSAISPDYTSATFVSNTSDSQPAGADGLQNLLYYNSNKLSIIEEVIVQTDLRDFNIYKVLFNTVDKLTNPIEVYIVVAHLKAQDSVQDANRRFFMIEELDNYLSTLPADSNVILGGDLNLYRASELAFQKLIDNTNNIPFVDPVNRIGEWSDTGDEFVDVFTQSTRTQFNLGGAAGGFDDRFDFILTSTNLLSASNAIRYVANSYEAYGNNKQYNCFNSAINSSDCAFGADSGNPDSSAGYTLTIRNALRNFSDHLPVIMEVEIDSQLLSNDDVFVQEINILPQTLVSHTLKLNFIPAQLFNKDVVIYNGMGQKVVSTKIGTDSQQSINISGLSNGIYYLKLAGTSLNPVKFVVAH